MAPPNPDLKILVERVEKLEQQNSTLIVVAAILLLCSKSSGEPIFPD